MCDIWEVRDLSARANRNIKDDFCIYEAEQNSSAMKPKKKQKKLRITEADFMLANRRAARLEEIAEHGRPVSMRTALHKSKKVYDRKRLKKAGINSDDLPSLH